ncbi:MAG: CocE/NonD family hydrolase [Oscillatoriales cyanobacterium RM2_1_1]|nr:CocE/NonD family hydrolase [Oscillatoriales cyanobacterium SM2_3_0]NJO44203.1 CocE/NonD family hydrolase [Oscillatoriales cyanobacterium RM2_1_1]
MVLKESASMLSPDGIRLDADVYYPDGPGEFPVLLMRQPYGRAIASTVVYAHPSWYAAQGYIVVIQDVRGRGTSEGEFRLFQSEITDGVETVNWAANLPRSNGQVGMYGFSYQGMTQLYVASQKPHALKTICPAMVGYDLYADWAYEGGAFCFQANLGWAIQLAAETARRKGDEAAYQTLHQGAQMPLVLMNGSIPAVPELLSSLAPDSFYHDWITHPQPDEYWKSLSPNLSGVDLPMLHIGGWFDTYLRGTLNVYRQMAQQCPSPQHLIIGPWAHLPWGRKVGAVDYGLTANNLVDDLQIRWFDQFLKGMNTGILEEPAIALFEMGSNQWQEFDTWPEARSEHPHSSNSKSYLLFSNGLANIRDDAGILLEIIEESGEEQNESPDQGYLDRVYVDKAYTDKNLSISTSLDLMGQTPDPQTNIPAEGRFEPGDIIVHDPWRPVPSLGGHAGFPPGSFDRSSLDCRSDILTYTSAPLTTELHLLGSPQVQLYCHADTPSYDLCAVLSEVRPDGSVYHLTQGYQRLDQLQNPVQILLQATCVWIPRGHGIRLSISGACFPAYLVNSGTAQPLTHSRSIDARVITISVYSGEQFPAQVTLPLSPIF